MNLGTIAVGSWLVFLWSVSILNVYILWAKIIKKQTSWSIMVVCSVVYTLVCAFRSFLPRIDAERLCFFDLTLSSPFIGRSLATVAEVCFGYQISRFWFKISGAQGILGKCVREVIFLSCCSAQAWCWMGVLTRNQLYHAIEESHWLVAALVLTLSTLVFTKHHSIESLVTILMGGLFSLFMALIDIPMYLKKDADLAIPIIPWQEGIFDSMRCHILGQSWDHWKVEMAWLSGYFSMGVWISLYISYTWTLKKKQN